MPPATNQPNPSAGDSSTLKIFLSFANEQRALAKEVHAALSAQGHAYSLMNAVYEEGKISTRKSGKQS
jgi:hypothetical protein